METTIKFEKAPETATVAPIMVIKRYSNRKLYNKTSHVYVTLDDIYQMVKNGLHVTVTEDAPTFIDGVTAPVDITKEVLSRAVAQSVLPNLNETELILMIRRINEINNETQRNAT